MKIQETLPLIYTDRFDNELTKLPIYQLYPELLPLVGSHIDQVNKHYLFIGESHYLPAERTIHKNHDMWYDARIDLDEIEKYWLSTRKIINKGRNQKYESKAHSIYINIEKALIQSGYNPDLQDNMFRYCSFMNFFQRPAMPNISIKNSHLDSDKAFETLQHVALTIIPDILIFVSKKAYATYEWFVKDGQGLNIPFHVVPHPTTSWWNRKSKKYKDDDGNLHTGKEHLNYILRKNGNLDLFPTYNT